MNFVQFAEAHGLILKGIEGDGRWHRVPTTDKPRHRNGAYKYLGDVAFVQNHATMAEVAVWKANTSIGPIDATTIRRQQAIAKREVEEQQRAAAKVASEALRNATLSTHPYLARKGFPDEMGLVDDGMLLIPMRDYANYRNVLSVQRISPTGEKKFLYGGRSRGAVFKIGNGRERWFCEGYATGLSIKAALESMYRQATVVVCFSANNMELVAKDQPGYVFADNDASETGQKAAEAIGSPWVMSPMVGEDANDYMQRMGVPALAKLMREVYG